jgi:AraC family transcriptional regulator
MNNGGLRARVQSDPAGVIESPAPADPHLLIHIGRSVEIECERGGMRHRGISVHGDIDIIPVGVASRWTLKKSDRALLLRIPQDCLNRVAEESGIDVERATLLNRFQIRDPWMEQLAWLAKAELDDPKSGKLYLEGIGTALASRLLHAHSTHESKSGSLPSWGMPGARLRRVLSFIEDNLDQDLSLRDIALISGLSVTHSQRAFRSALGVSIHQYIISQRVKRAMSLLEGTSLSITDVALEVGFSHQSHLSLHMRRVMGISPAKLRRRVRIKS